MKKRSIAILLSLLLLLGLSACGGSAPRNAASGSTAFYGAAADTATAESAYWDAEMPMEAETQSKSDGGTLNPTRANIPESVKMIYRANLELETTEYEKAQSDIVTLTNQLGGYFEEQSSNN